MALQGERLVESHELRRRGEMLVRFHRQQKITDDIITRQRQIMEGASRIKPIAPETTKLSLPSPLSFFLPLSFSTHLFLHLSPLRGSTSAISLGSIRYSSNLIK